MVDETTRRTRMPGAAYKDKRLIAGLLLIVVFVLFSPPSVMSRLSFISTVPFPRNVAVGLLILSAWSAVLLALVCASMSQPLVKWSLFALVTVSFVIMETYRQAVGAVMMFSDYLTLWTARQMAGDALSQYASAIWPAISWGALLLLGFLLVRRQHRRCGQVAALCLVLSAALFAGVCYKKGGAATQLLPASTAVYGLVAAQSINNAYAQDYHYTYSEGPRHAPLVQNIVLIVDESIRSDFFNRIVLPRIRSNKNWQTHDFGPAVSMSNCSGATNLMLRKGARFSSIKSDIYGHGLIWDLATRAGFTSYLLDAQSHGIGNNHMDHREMSMVGHVPTTDWADDPAILDSMDYLNGKNRTFTYIIKMGAHFPYSSHYPATFSYKLEAETHYMNDKERKEYANAIAYQTGRFFDKLMTTQVSTPTLIIYISDHGQNVNDRPGKTHCNSAIMPNADEGVVPFVILTNYQDHFIDALQKARTGKMSHFDIPPMIRKYMGYDTDQYQEGKPDSPTLSSFLYGSPFGYFGESLTTEQINRDKYQRLEDQRWLRQ